MCRLFFLFDVKILAVISELRKAQVFPSTKLDIFPGAIVKDGFFQQPIERSRMHVPYKGGSAVAPLTHSRLRAVMRRRAARPERHRARADLGTLHTQLRQLQ